MWPKISIITPSYNQGRYLEQTIQSVLQQQYPNLEYIIIDGGSTDDSAAIIQRYSNQLSYWVSEPDHGQSDALNKGCKRATGEIIAWINSDDYYEKDALFKVATHYIQTGFDFFCGSCCMINQEGQFIRELHTPVITYRTLIKYWQPHFCPPQPSLFFKRQILHDLDYFDPSLQFTMDFDLWLKASQKYSFLVSSENLSYYRVHTNSKTGSTGGLGKFVPEWKMLIRRSLQNQPLPVQFTYYLNEWLHTGVVKYIKKMHA
jgi:glycosyltransferase involved in cell wall biosynthesis